MCTELLNEFYCTVSHTALHSAWRERSRSHKLWAEAHNWNVSGLSSFCCPLLLWREIHRMDPWRQNRFFCWLEQVMDRNQETTTSTTDGSSACLWISTCVYLWKDTFICFFLMFHQCFSPVDHRSVVSWTVEGDADQKLTRCLHIFMFFNFILTFIHFILWTLSLLLTNVWDL